MTNGLWGNKFGGNFVPETLKKPIYDLEVLLKSYEKTKVSFKKDKYFKNWIGSPTRLIKLQNLSDYIKGAQIWAKVVSDANGGAHKIYNATVHCLLAKKAGKNLLLEIQALVTPEKYKYGSKKFGLKCKIFMGVKDIYRQQPNVKAVKKMVLKLCQFVIKLLWMQFQVYEILGCKL